MIYIKRPSLHPPHRSQWCLSSAAIMARVSSAPGRMDCTCSDANGSFTRSRIGPTSRRLHQFGDRASRMTPNIPIPTRKISSAETQCMPRSVMSPLAEMIRAARFHNKCFICSNLGTG